MNIEKELYSKITQVLPIICVDVLVTDRLGRVLLVKRTQAPARDQWWQPGGRVHYGELRSESARRILQEECGLSALTLQEVGTFDLIFKAPDELEEPSHDVTTVFHAAVRDGDVRLDFQSSESQWRLPKDWMQDIRNEHVRRVLEIADRRIQDGAPIEKNG